MEMALHCRNHWDVVEGLRPCSRCGQTFCRDCLVDINGLPYCANCKNEQLLDVRSGVAATTLNLASIGKRFLAFFIDCLIIGIPFGVLMFAAIMTSLSSGQFRPENIVAIQAFSWLSIVAMLIYEGLMLGARGQTVGKMAMGIKGVPADGGDLTKAQACARPAIPHVLVSCLCIINYLPVFFTPDRTTLHDMVASTRVVNWS